jgi:glycosyltransferase involved in cell wall biosynthesis
LDVVVTIEYRFERTTDGATWTDTLFDAQFWSRYLDVFDRILIVGRCREVSAPSPRSTRVDSDRVTVVDLPHYIGPLQYLRVLRAFRRRLKSLRPHRSSSAFIFRVPSQIAEALLKVVKPKTYAVEVIGDPYDVFAPGAVKHPLRPLLRWKFGRDLRRLCSRANAAAYVTERALQRRYPASVAAVRVHYSSIELRDEALASSARHFTTPPGNPRIVAVGTLDQMYKGFDVLIDAVAIARTRGLNASLTIVGGGKHEQELRQLSSDREVPVTFTGRLAGPAAVREHLDRADLFVMPSRQEGLPRALIEAMARALPAIGTRVGGIPELLDDDFIVQPDDVNALASAMIDLCASPVRLTAASSHNLEVAKRYRSSELSARRRAFYSAYRDIAERASR